MPLSVQGVRNVKSILDDATKTGAPGLVFLAVDKTGSTLVEHASGTRSVDSKEPMTLETTFWLASMTKIVTAIAILQLVESGKLTLDDADFIHKYAPELAKKKVWVNGRNGEPQEQKSRITMRMLLSHTAGFGYAFFDARVAGLGRPAGIDEFAGDEKDILESPLVNQPGRIWEYGINIDWAGLILERLTGLKLNDYMQANIFQPAGINHVTMFPTPEMRQNLAYMHQRDPDGTLKERDHIFRRALRAESEEEKGRIFNSGGGGLWGRVGEYGKIMSILLNDGKSPQTGAQILQSETVKMMWENQIPEHPDFSRNGPPPPNPLLANHAEEMYPQEGRPPQGWGLSMHLTLAPGATGRGENTGWWCGLANLFWWVDKERGVGGVLASQVLPFGDPKVAPVWGAVEREVYNGLE
ncbi:beta-lactamase [Delitschia confertaspora ATCC 74209]|uniref:Beta-lactamase n=1 Tax=Delitschia confertaspora ATCC 74209 TaxID=1513339 RepID=A0A9P4MPC1_9PLEO|nr:beta-lactamase [Delitschia confertaspora ATCC 74209]